MDKVISNKNRRLLPKELTDNLVSLVKGAYKLLHESNYSKLAECLRLILNDKNFKVLEEDIISEITLLFYFHDIRIDALNEFINALDFSNLPSRIKADISITKALILAKQGLPGHVKCYLESQTYFAESKTKSINYFVIQSNYFFFTNKINSFYKIVEKEFINTPIITGSLLDLDIYNILGVYYGMHNDLTKSFEMFYNILIKAKKIKFNAKIAIAQTNLATIEAKLFNYDSALTMYTDILENYSKHLDSARQTYILNNVAHLELQNGNVEKAANCLANLKLEEIPNKSPFYELSICQLTRINILQDNMNKANYYIEKYNTFIGDKHHLAIHYLNLAMSKTNFKEAENWALKSKQSCIETNNNETLKECLYFLRTLYQENSNSKAYVTILEEIIELKDTYLLLQKSGQNTDIKIKTLLIEKEVKIRELEQEAKYSAIMLKKNEEIKKSNDRLQEKVDELKTFAYIVSHDLKEPMRMITSFAELLLAESKALDQKSKEYLNFITTGTERMNNLLDGLYKYTSLNARRNKTIEEIDLNKIIVSALQNLSIVIREKNAVITYPILPIIQSNHILLIQLFQNLVGNALKFTPKGTNPKIEINYRLENATHIISVKDNGIGIPQHEQENIFEVFRTLNTKEEFPGTGIGLSICKKIIKFLNGKLSLNSKIGEGSEFIITLPC